MMSISESVGPRQRCRGTYNLASLVPGSIIFCNPRHRYCANLSKHESCLYLYFEPSMGPLYALRHPARQALRRQGTQHGPQVPECRQPGGHRALLRSLVRVIISIHGRDQATALPSRTGIICTLQASPPPRANRQYGRRLVEEDHSRRTDSGDGRRYRGRDVLQHV